MTAIRLGVCFIGIGIGLLIAGIIRHGSDDLLHIGAVGCIVFGAVAVCIATEAKSSGAPPRPKQEGRPARPPKAGSKP